MTFFAAGTKWSVDQAPLEKIILLHWVGGSYGNFIYRMIHAHVEGLVDLEDDFFFKNGSSHSIRKNSYINDIFPNVRKDNDIILNMSRNVDCEYLVVRKHSSAFVPVLPLKIIRESKINIKIVLEDEGLAAWSLIQNIIKLDNPHEFYNHYLVDSISSNNINVEKIAPILKNSVKAVQKNWFLPTQKENFINLNLSDIFENQKLLDFILSFSNKLGLKTKNLDSFDLEMTKFKESQIHIDSLFRHLQRNWDISNPIDFLLKDCYENINHK